MNANRITSFQANCYESDSHNTCYAMLWQVKGDDFVSKEIANK